VIRERSHMTDQKLICEGAKRAGKNIDGRKVIAIYFLPYIFCQMILHSNSHDKKILDKK